MTSRARHGLPPSLTWSGALLVAFACVVGTNEVVGLLRGVTPGPVNVAFALALLALTAAVASGLRRRRRWAWLLALSIAVVGLFLVAPVLATILLGGGLEPVGTGWDVVYFPLIGGLLLTVLALLRSARAEVRAGGGGDD